MLRFVVDTRTPTSMMEGAGACRARTAHQFPVQSQCQSHARVRSHVREHTHTSIVRARISSTLYPRLVWSRLRGAYARESRRIRASVCAAPPTHLILLFSIFSVLVCYSFVVFSRADPHPTPKCVSVSRLQHMHVVTDVCTRGMHRHPTKAGQIGIRKIKWRYVQNVWGMFALRMNRSTGGVQLRMSVVSEKHICQRCDRCDLDNMHNQNANWQIWHFEHFKL